MGPCSFPKNQLGEKVHIDVLMMILWRPKIHLLSLRWEGMTIVSTTMNAVRTIRTVTPSQSFMNRCLNADSPKSPFCGTLGNGMHGVKQRCSSSRHWIGCLDTKSGKTVGSDFWEGHRQNDVGDV